MKTKLHKKTLNLRRGDWEALDNVYSAKGLSVSTVIRYVVSQHVDRLKVDQMEAEELMKEINL